MRLPERSRLPDHVEIPGLYPPRRRRLPNWPVALWLVVAAVAAIPIVGIPGVVLAHYTTSNSDFCLTCHQTGDTPDRGVRSEVHPDFNRVSCVDCHAKPGQIVFEGYVKGFLAEPERVSNNCVRCHSSVAERTDQQGFKFNVQRIAIDHQAHLNRGATCVTCHANVAHDLETPRTNRPQMESCYSCHSRADSCMKCHAAGLPPAAPSRETVGRRPVTPPRPAQATTAPPEAKTAASGAPIDTKALEEGKTLFAQSCAGCHGAEGAGLPSANLKSKGYLEGYGAEALVRATADGKGAMPGFGVARGGPLTDDQVRAIVAYLLSVAQ